MRALTRQLPVGDFLLVAIPRAQFANEPTGKPPEAAPIGDGMPRVAEPMLMR